jgi:hypothetical protein
MRAFAGWIEATALSQALSSQADWLWPLSESVHFVGLVLVIGCAGFFDLRLMGLMKGRVSIAAARQLIPWAQAGLCLSLSTGLIFFISEPQQYVVKAAWWAKVAFLAVAMMNALVFEVMFGKRLDAIDPADDPPLALRVIGFVSLVAWLGALYFGRMLPYLEPGLDSNL